MDLYVMRISIYVFVIEMCAQLLNSIHYFLDVQLEN